jgi:hypothetical protein
MVGEAGLAQIIDIGAGLPTANPTHEVAQQVNPNTTDFRCFTLAEML